MELSILQEALIHYLKKFNLEREAIMLISLMLSKSEDGIRTFIYLAHHDKVETQEEFLMLARAIVDFLPSEERVGTPMDLEMKM